MVGFGGGGGEMFSGSMQTPPSLLRITSDRSLYSNNFSLNNTTMNAASDGEKKNQSSEDSTSLIGSAKEIKKSSAKIPLPPEKPLPRDC